MKCCVEFYFTMKTEGKKKETGAGGVRASICPWKSNFPLCSSVRNQGHGKRDKNIYIVLVLAFKGFRQVLLIQGHTKTRMHTHTSQHVQHQLGRFQHHCDE